MSAWARAVKEGLGVFLDGNQEGVMIHVFSRGCGGRLSHLGKINVAGMYTGID